MKKPITTILKKVWHDPVGSKIIANALIGIPALLLYLIGLITEPIKDFIVNNLHWFAIGILFINVVVLNMKLAGLGKYQTSSRPDAEKEGPKRKTPLEWLNNREKDLFTKYIFLFWFPINKCVRHPYDNNICTSKIAARIEIRDLLDAGVLLTDLNHSIYTIETDCYHYLENVLAELKARDDPSYSDSFLEAQDLNFKAFLACYWKLSP